LPDQRDPPVWIVAFPWILDSKYTPVFRTATAGAAALSGRVHLTTRQAAVRGLPSGRQVPGAAGAV